MTTSISPVPVCGDTIIHFPHDAESGRVGFQLYPAALNGQLATHRTGLAGLPFIDSLPDHPNPRAWAVDPLVQVKILGDSYSGAFASGHTMRNSPSVDRLKYQAQRVEKKDGRTVIVTTLKSTEGLEAEHRTAWREGDLAMEIETTFRNGSDKPVTLEMLSSFSLGGLSPFDATDSTGRLRVHRFRSAWASEGRLETRTIEELHLERSWIGAGMFSERYGQIGSMPVRRWFPFVAVEDTVTGVTWGVQLAWAGSWQLEIFRQNDDVCLSGGLADREFGHWMKTLAPGESLTAPPAYLACVQGGLDEVCDRLTAMQQRAADTHPKVDHDLPIIFNEWCTTWGDPQHDKVLAIADRLKGSETKFLVIDAGWYKQGAAGWEQGHGDWIPSAKLFPKGLEATAAAIRQAGFIPGLWFEMETVGQDSTAFSITDHLLKRDGIPLTTRGRRFWDLNDPGAIDYLTKKVIDLLERGNFGYLKVDYNETIGLGCDHPDGVGEGLRRQVEGIYRFFEKIRKRLPDLVIENCSSGGHRLEPSMMARTAQASFSDAHELVEIPIIAANLHRLILPRQSQIWAVLHSSDSDRRLVYSLAATFLGRMALSGGIADMSPAQWELIMQSQRLYRQVAPIIKHGTSRRFGKLGESWRHPKGWQAMRRVSSDDKAALVVIHTFEEAPTQVEVPLPPGKWRIQSEYPAAASTVKEGSLVRPVEGDFSAAVIHLSRA